MIADVIVSKPEAPNKKSTIMVGVAQILTTETKADGTIVDRKSAYRTFLAAYDEATDTFKLIEEKKSEG